MSALSPRSAVIEGGRLTVKDGRIASVATRGGRLAANVEEVNGQGRLLLPGFIDLHNDGIEQEIEPRPRAVFPLAVALQSLETQLVGPRHHDDFPFLLVHGRTGRAR